MTKIRCPDSLPGTSKELKTNSIGQIEGCSNRLKSLEWKFRNDPFPLFHPIQKSSLLDEAGIVSLTIEEVDHG